VPPQRLVPAVYELGWIARACLLAGAVELGADVLLRSVAEFSERDLFIVVMVFGIPSFAILTTLLLGRRTDVSILYAQIFDHAPGPPRDARVEPGGRIARRAVAAVIGLAVLLVLPAAFGVAFLLLMMGTPRDQVLDHLPVATGLVTAGWILLCGLAALRISHYFARWEQRRGRVVLSRPLAAGSMQHVYYVANRPPGAFKH
jgi:type IV secretory pathway TrbD component